MRNQPLLAVALLAIGCPSFAVAQSRLPGDWEQKVSAAVAEPERARKVAEAGRAYDAKRQESLDVMKAAKEELKAVFLSQASSVGKRQLSLNLFRDKRRKASLAAVDALLATRYFVSGKEWNALWPKGYFDFDQPAPLLAVKVQEALPSAVADPARLKQAGDVAAKLAAAAKDDESARRKATGRLSKLFESWESQRDDFIDLVNKLEDSQLKVDDALIAASGELQKVLTPEEWNAFVGRVSSAP